MASLDPKYWEERWRQGHTPWDIGTVSPPLQDYIDQLTDKAIAILIPGAGRAHEALYLHQQGFTKVYVCDWAASAFNDLRNAAPDFPEDHLIVGDFFQLQLPPINLILEQTFFCAIDPDLRVAYAQKAAQLLADDGKLVGVLFARRFPFAGPPFGGTTTEYEEVFSPYFQIQTMGIAHNSVKPRLGNELFIELGKIKG